MLPSWNSCIAEATESKTLDRFFELTRAFFEHHGYWAVTLALLLENAGLPVPGETVLLFASFLAFSERNLHLPWIIVVGTVACTIAGSLGYAIGWRGGRTLLERWKHRFRIQQDHIDRGERLFARYGSWTVFFARFVFGLRVIAGPLAGVLRMDFKKFAVANFLGAVVWVAVVSCGGYFFGSQWQRLVHIMRNVNLILVGIIALIGVAAWWISLRRRRQRTS
jgi:membrane protein DedA with SNARE-associated domain